MGHGFIDKLTNFLMPLEPGETDESPIAARAARKAALQVHSPASLKVYVAVPRTTEDVCHLADCLKNKMAILVNYGKVDSGMQKSIHEFLCGVAYVTRSCYTEVSERVYMYVPEHADFDKRLYAASAPASRNIR